MPTKLKFVLAHFFLPFFVLQVTAHTACEIGADVDVQPTQHQEARVPVLDLGDLDFELPE